MSEKECLFWTFFIAVLNEKKIYFPFTSFCANTVIFKKYYFKRLCF